MKLATESKVTEERIVGGENAGVAVGRGSKKKKKNQVRSHDIRSLFGKQKDEKKGEEGVKVQPLRDASVSAGVTAEAPDCPYTPENEEHVFPVRATDTPAPNERLSPIKMDTRTHDRVMVTYQRRKRPKVTTDSLPGATMQTEMSNDEWSQLIGQANTLSANQRATTNTGPLSELPSNECIPLRSPTQRRTGEGAWAKPLDTPHVEDKRPVQNENGSSECTKEFERKYNDEGRVKNANWTALLGGKKGKSYRSPKRERKKQKDVHVTADTPAGQHTPEARVQMVLDLGQKGAGWHQCSECGMTYSVAVDSDRALHVRYHANRTKGVSLPGWKDERVVSRPSDSERIIVVTSSDPALHLRKVQEVWGVVNEELGFSGDRPLRTPWKTYLYITSDKRVGGCIVAEPISCAYRALAANQSQPPGGSSDSEQLMQAPANITAHSLQAVSGVCGIHRVWVSRANRRRGLATMMLDALRADFLIHRLIDRDQLAFSQPTPLGKSLAIAYTGRSDFKVYA